MMLAFLGIEKGMDQSARKLMIPAMSKAITPQRTGSVDRDAPVDNEGTEDSPLVRDGSVLDAVPCAVDALVALVAPVSLAAGIVVEAKPRPLGPMLMV